MSRFSLKDFFGNALDSIIKSIGDAIDKNVTNKEEKLRAQKEITEVLLKYQGTLDSEVTERLKADMQSDNVLAKSIRPISLIFTTLVIAALSITDGNFGEFTINESYITLYQALLMLQYGFYFGSRGAEKIMTTINKSKK